MEQTNGQPDIPEEIFLRIMKPLPGSIGTQSSDASCEPTSGFRAGIVPSNLEGEKRSLTEVNSMPADFFLDTDYRVKSSLATV